MQLTLQMGFCLSVSVVQQPKGVICILSIAAADSSHCGTVLTVCEVIPGQNWMSFTPYWPAAVQQRHLQNFDVLWCIFHASDC